MKCRKNGFTLIELLVVISIIALISSIALASLNSARNKAKDAIARSSLSATRNTAALYYDRNEQNYGKICEDDRPTLDLIDQATLATNHLAECTELLPPATAFATQVLLLDGTYWCADSTGYAGPGYDLLQNTEAVCDVTP